ncbi:MAG: single-stranded-DNA-specific exonuclease RecJ [Candidatus Omnitrophota bacterium]|nr:single-stranded-DNA-specific exonuclease RecJ [Candidatus Omnitrophota bacterium]
MMQKIWEVKEQNIELQEQLSRALKAPRIISQLLINRGVGSCKEAQGFLEGGFADLHDPFLLKDIKQAVRRIKKAVSGQEQVMICGDYDVDGVTSVAIMVKVLTKLGLRPKHYIPDRLKEGYGLNKPVIRKAGREGVSLLIALDCGTANFKEVEYAAGLGIDTIIVDHHQPGDGLIPKALAVINPKRGDSTYPYKDLAAVGLVFKLIQVLTGQQEALSYLDLVTLGTIADVVPMTGENRLIVRNGLDRLTNTRSPGIRALIGISGLSNKEITSRHVSYILAPRLNAAGRIDSAALSLGLLLTSENQEAVSLAKILDQKNKERQKIQQKTFTEIIGKIEEGKEINFKVHKTIILWNENWHLGIVGIVASKIAERYYRPTIIISLKEGVGKGSGRSIRDFHLFNAVKKCGRFLERFGGHKKAIGLTVMADNLSDFRQMANLVASEELSWQDLTPKVEIDSEISLNDLSLELLEEIKKLQPFGPQNRYPVFSSPNVILKTAPEVVGRRHLKMWITDNGAVYPAIWYDKAVLSSLDWEKKPFAVAYSPSVRVWQGRKELHLEIKDIKLKD